MLAKTGASSDLANPCHPICDALRDLVLFVQFKKACNFTKINTPPWVFFTFFKLYKWYQIEQRITYTKSCCGML